MHSDEDRKEEQVEEKNTGPGDWKNDKVKQRRKWSDDVSDPIYKDWLQECFWHRATLLDHVHENLKRLSCSHGAHHCNHDNFEVHTCPKSHRTSAIYY